jgi:hypothetical protein
MTNSIIREFVENQRELLDLELQAETIEEQESLSSANNKNKNSSNNEEKVEERASHILGQLEASDVSVGLYGRTVVSLSVWSESIALRASADNNNDKKTLSSSIRLLPAHVSLNL